ncbi:hypothetical protein BGX26_002397 [Mortierella sp. AD094]|nr:hypothetical protein BGX26_002397 [Mortierella sp. AD094]
MIQNLFSSPSSGLPLNDVLELANKHLDNARSASIPIKVRHLCDTAKAAIKEAENIVINKKVKGQTVHDNIANVYQKHGNLLEELGQQAKAQKSYGKAKKWGYIHLAAQPTGSPILQSLCHPYPLSAAPSVTVTDQIHQGHAKDTTPSEIKDQIPEAREDTVWIPQAIFGHDVATPVAKFAFPESGGRITSTPQLAYCLSLLQDSLISKGELDKAECDWLKVMKDDPDEQRRLQILATDVIRAFVRHELKRSDVVAETVSLTAVLDQDDFRKLLEVFVDGIEQSLLLKNSDPCMVYQAAYAYQALQYIPDDETVLQAMIRRTGKVVQGISGVVSAVKALGINGFIDGLRYIEGGLAGAGKAIVIVNDAYQNAKTLTESGQEFLESLKEGLNFSRKSAWYPALRGLDALLQESRLLEFEKLIREAPCRQDPAFQWGMCQRLGELAANTVWDDDTRQCAIVFLGEIYSDDAQWGHQAEVKQWILHILTMLAKSAESSVTSHAKRLLQSLETDGDTKKCAIYQAHLKGDENQYILQVASPSLHGSQLLDSVQNKPDIKTPLHQLKYERLRGRSQGVYISPRAKANPGATEDFDLTSKVEEFLNSSKKVFLLLGDSGSGKSTFNSVLEVELWDKYEKTNGPIPLFIHLPTIEKPEHDLIAERLRRANFTENQIRELKLHREFVLICDGYDESQQTRNLYTSNQLNQPGQWCVQMVISCRTEYIGVDYRDCFWPTDANSRGNSGLFQEAVLVPFDKNQIQDYIDQYVSYSRPLWGTDDYLQALKKIPNLQDLVTNPFLLKIAVEVLPKLVDTRNDFSQIRITRVQLYDGFIAQWIERGKIRLGEMELSSRDKEAFKILLGSGFSELGIEYLKELATAIYDNQGGIPVVKYSDRRDQKTWKKAFFDNSDGKNLLREAIPLMHNGDQYRFMHRSILEYGLSLAVFDPQAHHEDTEPTPTSSRRGSTSSILSFEEQTSIEETVIAIEQKLLESPFGRRSIVDESSISQFLVDRTQGHLVFKQQLHAVLERSKTEKAARVASANAITVLVRAGVQFVKADLRGIRIPGADLSYGMFDSAQLNGADLRKTKLHNIWLRKANLSGAQMAGVQFGELPLLQEQDMVMCCAYSQDDKMLAVGLVGGDVGLYDTSNWRKIRTLRGHTDRINCLVLSDASDRIATGSGDGEVRLWDVQTGNCAHTLNCRGNILAISKYLPKGYHVASGGEDNAFQLWNFETGNCVHTLQGHDDGINSAAYSPNGSHIASGSEDTTVRLWNVETGDCVHILQGHGDSVASVVFSPNGDQVASGSWDNTVRLWTVETGNCVHILHGHSIFIFSMIYSPNGDHIASGSADQTLRLWDVATGDCIHTLQGHGGPVASVVYSPNGSRLASGSWDQTVRLWDVKAGHSLRTLQGHCGYVHSVAISPNRDRIASASSDGTVRIWSMKAGCCVHIMKGHDNILGSVAYSPNGCQVASGSMDKTVRLWDAETGNCIHTLSGHTADVDNVIYSPNGGQVASGSFDKTVRLWDAETGNCIHILQGHGDVVTSIAYSPNGDQIASGSKDSTVRLWSSKTGDCVQIMQDHDDAVNSVVYSPNGGQIASASEDCTTRLWSTETGNCVHTLQGHTREVNTALYAPGGGQIASGSQDKTVRLWNTETGDCVHTLQGHSHSVLIVAYSPCGDRVASASWDNTVRLWDVETGQFLVAISGFSAVVTGIALDDTSDGRYLVTGSGDKSVRRWQVVKERDEFQVDLCWSSSRDGLTAAEAHFNDVQGLSVVNWTLLKQRGALVIPSSQILN